MREPCPDCRCLTSNAPYICDECAAKHRKSLRENAEKAMYVRREINDKQQETQMSEKQKLIDRLCSDPARRLVKFGVSKGDGWNAATSEERAEAINKCLDADEDGPSFPLNFDDSQHK